MIFRKTSISLLMCAYSMLGLNSAFAEEMRPSGITELARSGFEIRASVGAYLFLQNGAKIYVCSERVPGKLFGSVSSISEDELICLPFRRH